MRNKWFLLALLAFFPAGCGGDKPLDPVKPGGNSSASSAVSAKEPEYKIGDQMEVEPGTYIFRNVKNYDLIISHPYYNTTTRCWSFIFLWLNSKTKH